MAIKTSAERVEKKVIYPRLITNPNTGTVALQYVERSAVVLHVGETGTSAVGEMIEVIPHYGVWHPYNHKLILENM